MSFAKIILAIVVCAAIGFAVGGPFAGLLAAIVYIVGFLMGASHELDVQMKTFEKGKRP